MVDEVVGDEDNNYIKTKDILKKDNNNNKAMDRIRTSTEEMCFSSRTGRDAEYEPD